MARASSPDHFEPTIPRQWVKATIVDGVHCRGCGYDLRGLSAGGRCPECGLEVWITVQHTADPASSRLPSIRNPVAVGNSLVCLTMCMLLGALLMISPRLADLIDSWGAIGLRQWSDRVPALRWEYALVLLAAMIWAVWNLAPPRASEPRGPVWTDIWRVALGAAGWLAFATWWSALPAAQSEAMERLRLVLHLATVAFAGIGLIGLRGVFRIIGERSREYRRSKGGRQSLELIFAALVAGLLAMALGYVRRLGWFPAEWSYAMQMLATVVLWISSFMALIGLAYLMLNAWWIRNALRRPPPPLDQILMPPLPHDTSIPD